jgi:long-chain acyl-CoA synthetase
MPVWQSEDVREADEAVLGVATTEISTHLFLTPIAAIDHWAGRNPQASCLIAEAVELSYEQVAQLTRALAAEFKARGARSGDRVVLELENGLGVVLSFLALNRLGAAAVIVSPRLSEFERQKIVSHALPIAVITAISPPNCDLLQSALTTKVLTTLGLVWSDDGAAGPLDRAQYPLAANVAAMIYTTGTTGEPKGVMLTHQNLMFTGFVSGKLRGLGEADRVLTALPLSHAFGLSAVLCSVLTQGASLELMATFSATGVLARLGDGAITGFLGVPAMYTQLISADRDNALNYPFLRFLFSGGAPLDPTLKKTVETRFGLPLHNGYGLTESGPTIAQTRLYAPLDDTSVGFVIPGVDYQIVGASTSEEGIGELKVRGPNIMAGYYRNQAQTDQVLIDGWLATGDLARINVSGALEIVGRIKELIIKNGFNVYPPEVEAALLRLPEIIQAAVIGQAVPGNERIIAFVQTSASKLDLGRINQQLRSTLAGYKLLDEIRVVDQLPAAPSGKILKHRLADLL